MNHRTESDLRAVYTDPVGIDDVEQRLLGSISDFRRCATVPRRRTSLRTWTAAGAGAMSVVAVTVTAAVVIPHRWTPAPTGAATAPNPSALTRAPLTPRTATATRAQSVPMTPQVAVQTLISLLPRPGTTTELSGTTGPGWAGGTLVYDDGQGAAELSVGVTFPYTGEDGRQRLAAGSLCTSPGVVQLRQPCTTEPDGSQVAVYQGDANISGGAEDWEVSVLRTDGVEIDITEWNSATEKGGSQTRTDPPFTTAELTAMARSSAWRATVSDVRARRAAHLFVAASIP